MTERFYSQFGEDRLLAKLFAGKHEGFCVEVGANDGVNDSNTYYFEQLGWDCVLVEPNPDLCAQIRQTRRSHLFECAVSSTAGFAELNIAVGPGRAHGVSSLGNTREAVSRIAAFGFTSKSLTVQTRTLDEILREVGAPPGINFVSIDVEGHELEVLKGLSLGEWKPVILVIEDNSNFESEAVSEHLAGFGYVRFNRTGVNDWYAHCSNKHLVTKRRLVALRWKSLRARAESRLQRIPGLVYIVRKLRGT